MKHAFVFPGQGSQFSGMGQSLYNNNSSAKDLFKIADNILGFNISEIMFTGSDEALKQTNVTQPAVFLHAVILFKTTPGLNPDMVAGHSLGEFSALVANNTLSFEDALKLVAIRAGAMQKACEINPSAMAAVLGLEDEKIEEICNDVDSIVVAANYNCPGQVVISGTIEGVEEAMTLLKNAGAKRTILLPVGGAFHSPLMMPAKEELAQAIHQLNFNTPTCPVYQNVVAHPVSDRLLIKQNLIDQLTGPVKWSQSIEAMIHDGASHFTEIGPGKVLQGLINKINRTVQTDGIN